MKNRKLLIFICIIVLQFYSSKCPLLVSATTNDVLGLQSGEVYYIKNIYDEKYLEVKNTSDTSATDVWTNDFNGSESQKWRIQQNSDGSYTLYSLASPTGKVLDVSVNNIDIWSYDSRQSCQKFTLLRDTSLLQGGTYQIKNGNRFIISDVSSDTVIPSTSTPGLNSYWSFEPVQKDDADNFTFKYPLLTIAGVTVNYFDTTGASSTFVTKCTNMGYRAYHLQGRTAAFAFACLQSDSIWVFTGHCMESTSGNPMATLCFSDNSGNNIGCLTANSTISSGSSDRALDSLANNQLANLQCVLYMGCSTGVSYMGYNLVDDTISKGAHFALGTMNTLLDIEITQWVKKFFEKADTGSTIRDCIDHANYWSNIGTLHYRGDINAKLK